MWKKGVDSESFHPRFRSDAMRRRLAGGASPDERRAVMVYVGRLGFEKNLFFLKPILEAVPGLALAFVGDGPARAELQKAFRGTPTTFMGMLHVRISRGGGAQGSRAWAASCTCACVGGE